MYIFGFNPNFRSKQQDDKIETSKISLPLKPTICSISVILSAGAYCAFIYYTFIILMHLVHNARLSVDNPSWLLHGVVYNDRLPRIFTVCIFIYFVLDHFLSRLIKVNKMTGDEFFSRFFTYGTFIFAGIFLLIMNFDLAKTNYFNSGAVGYFIWNIQAAAFGILVFFAVIGMIFEWLGQRRPWLVWFRCLPPLLLSLHCLFHVTALITAIPQFLKTFFRFPRALLYQRLLPSYVLVYLFG